MEFLKKEQESEPQNVDAKLMKKVYSVDTYHLPEYHNLI